MKGSAKRRDRKWYDVVNKRTDIYQYSKGMYFHRNVKILGFLSNYKFRSIFEAAAGAPFLAEIINLFVHVDKYVLNDFSIPAIKFNRKFFKGRQNIFISSHDMEQPVKRVFENIDVFICNSLEHIENDIKLLSSIQEGAIIIICSPNFKSKSHVRYFESIEGMKERYKSLMSFEHEYIISNSHHEKYLLCGKKI